MLAEGTDLAVSLLAPPAPGTAPPAPHSSSHPATAQLGTGAFILVPRRWAPRRAHICTSRGDLDTVLRPEENPGKERLSPQCWLERAWTPCAEGMVNALRCEIPAPSPAAINITKKTSKKAETQRTSRLCLYLHSPSVLSF